MDDLCVTHTGFDTLALKKMVEKLDDRHLILEEDNNGVVTATIKAYPSPAKYVIQKGKVSYIQEYSGGTTKSEFNNNTVIEVLRKAGFEITKTTKDIITCAIDNYLDINVKTIDNLD